MIQILRNSPMGAASLRSAEPAARHALGSSPRPARAMDSTPELRDRCVITGVQVRAPGRGGDSLDQLPSIIEGAREALKTRAGIRPLRSPPERPRDVDLFLGALVDQGVDRALRARDPWGADEPARRRLLLLDLLARHCVARVREAITTRLLAASEHGSPLHMTRALAAASAGALRLRSGRVPAGSSSTPCGEEPTPE
jgi:hypothetical protein